MKANELRIGNYIQWADESEEINTVDIVGWRDGYGYFIKDNLGREAIEEEIDGIPLSIEWLIKFGFDQDDIGKKINYWGIGIEQMGGGCYGEFNIMFNDVGYWVILNWNYSGERHRSNIGNYKYVHQLQNLYFALTGEELEISK